MNVCITGEFSTHLTFSMLSFLIVVYALIGVQGKAFPSRYKRNYEGSYHYIPYEEGIVQIPAGYSPENLQNYQDYVHGYVQTNGHDWSAYYQPMLPQPIQHPYSNINGHHKMKSEHTWHFIDQSNVPVTQYTDGMHQFESDVEAPNVIEALVKKEVIDGHGEYDAPIVVEALIRKGHMDHADAEVPVVVDSLTVEEKPINSEYDGNALVTEPSSSYYMYKPIKDVAFISSNEFELPVVVDSLGKKNEQVKVEPVASYGALELPVVDSLTKKDKPVKMEPVASYGDSELPVVVDSLGKKDEPIEVVPVASYGAFELPVVDSLTKKDKPSKVEPVTSYSFKEPIKEKPIKEKPIKEKPIKEKPIKEKPIKEKPIKEKPIKSYEALDYPIELDSLNKVEEHEYETPVIEALIRKERPAFDMEKEYESPIVVEALVRKNLPVYENKNTNTKEDKILPKELVHPIEESILTKEDVENFDIPVVEALTFEQDTESNEIPKLEGTTFDETHGFDEPEMDSFDENVDHGSAMDFDGSRLARNFLPVNSNIFSIVANVQEQEGRKFKNCVTPRNETGNCMPFQLCSVSSAVINIDELLRNVCIIDEVFIGVCCPEFPVETVRVDWEQLKPDAEKLNEEKSSQISKECGRLPSMVTDQDPWPWMASLIAKSSDKIFCGGALIAEQYVLTAAHCTKRIPRNQILVRLGRPASENRPEPDFEVIEIKRHAGYNPRTMQNDIALLKLSRRVQLGDFRRVVCLAQDEGTEGLVSESASLLRWKETPGEIKDVESLAVISTQECQSRMRTAIADSILCTEPRTDETMCNADSGAPLIIAKDDKFEVIGILTWNRNDCDERFPAVFTRVSSYHRWIEKLAS
ncbi:Chymotrypsin-like protease CTRL-1 [Araneus ventricosus]|uniref:Chymotrypsin-like protease CTRL-1 n=1 Tax=Araneus ventricosus TaxID=182803 RepID=A0A4Y1ZXT1_ARAVE|nr:Chymotrypsin-like protease CTRL-1 [Araneus ventricosus]